MPFSEITSQLRELRANLGSTRLALVLGVPALLLAALLGLALRGQEPDAETVLSGLDSQELARAQEVLTAKGLPFALDAGTGAVVVPASHAVQARLTLAGEGLPGGGRLGFELFDDMRFGTTAFVESVNYRRALEGELARTIAGLEAVVRARVHLALPSRRLFQRERPRPKASVVLSLDSGQTLGPRELRAVVHLVSSAVEGLEPRDVNVVDTSGELLSRSRTGEDLELGEVSDLEDRLASSVVGLLEPVVGEGRIQVRVRARRTVGSMEETLETYDPDSPALASETRTLSDSDSGAAGQETSRYELSRTVRRTVQPEGRLASLSVAVLVDHAQDDAGGRRPRSQHELDQIRELVTAAVGLEPARGDLLRVVNVPFEAVRTAETVPAPEPAALPPAPLHSGSPAPSRSGLLAAGLLLLLLSLLLLDRRRRRGRRKAAVEAASGQDLTGDSVELGRWTRQATPAPPMGFLSERAMSSPDAVASLLQQWLEEPARDEGSAAERLPGSERAAVLLVVLGEDIAADLLKRLTREEVHVLARSVAELGPVPGEILEAVLAAARVQLGEETALRAGGRDYARRILTRSLGYQSCRSVLETLDRSEDLAAEFRALERVNPHSLARLLENEHPQTMALVLAHLDPSHAARVMGRLQPKLRDEVARRMASLETIRPEVVRRVARALVQRLDRAGPLAAQPHGGAHTVAELLNRMERQTSREILDGLETGDPELAGTVRDLMFVFEDIHRLDDATLKELLKRVDRRLLATALKGSSRMLRDRVLAVLSERARLLLAEEEELLGPMRAREAERAQHEIVALLRQLEDEGVVSLEQTTDEELVL